MAKGSRQGGKMVTKQVGAPKGRKAEFPVNDAESNEAADKQAMLLHYSLILVAILAVAGLFYWGGVQISSGLQAKPINWVSEVWGVTALAGIFFVARGLFWLSIISPVMIAAKGKGWKSQEDLCRKALKFSKLIPGGGLTVAFMLVQSLISRGKFDEALVLGEEQYKIYEKDDKMAEGLGPVLGALGLCHQIRGDAKQSINWSEKALEAYGKALEKYSSPKKSWLTKLSEAQGGDIAGSIKSQMTVSYFNNASSYFNMQNFRMAKVNFQKALEIANQSPEFPEKGDIIRACKEQLARLKHN
ncbi:MAG TPA: tetratricopeptide repeat protein [Oculatellaceae cyanobacterium]